VVGEFVEGIGVRGGVGDEIWYEMSFRANKPGKKESPRFINRTWAPSELRWADFAVLASAALETGLGGRVFSVKAAASRRTPY
jgi:hypothetical protein